MKKFKCPYKEQLLSGKLICNKGYSKCDDKNIKECPTDIFNKCQEFVYNNGINI